MLNSAAIMGRLTRDPELRHTQNNTPVVTLTLAVDRDYRDRDSGEKGVDFINVTAWRNTAEYLGRYARKGRLLCVTGRLQMRDYTDKNGFKRTVCEIVADNAYFGDSRPKDGEQDGPEPQIGPESQIDDNSDLPF